jgi:hypothetical protein
VLISYVPPQEAVAFFLLLLTFCIKHSTLQRSLLLKSGSDFQESQPAMVLCRRLGIQLSSALSSPRGYGNIRAARSLFK